MEEEFCKVTFRPANRTVRVKVGTTVLDAAAQADIFVDSPCGGRGRCGKCRVLFTEGASPTTDQEKQLLSPADIERGVRLACSARASEDSAVDIPPESEGVLPQALAFGAEERGAFQFDPP